MKRTPIYITQVRKQSFVVPTSPPEVSRPLAFLSRGNPIPDNFFQMFASLHCCPETLYQLYPPISGVWGLVFL